MSERGKALGQQLISSVIGRREDDQDVHVLVSHRDWLDLYGEWTDQFDITTLTIPNARGQLRIRSHPAIPAGKFLMLDPNSEKIVWMTGRFES